MSSKCRCTWLVAGLLAAACATSSDLIDPSFKFGPPDGGGGGGGGHEPGGTNNLSVPTLMIGGSFTGVTCGTDAPSVVVSPSGTPLTGYEVAGDYYVQGVHAWQAQCLTTTTATATAEWGDNLAGDAKLKVGMPIRVELGLFNADATVPEMQGFTVVKLEPSKLDRESAYGTVATPDGAGGHAATAEVLPARVFDGSATFSVQNVTTLGYAVPLGSNPTAEINATGRVVYGYNLRVTQPGEYDITFVIPNVTITGVDAGNLTASTVTLRIAVIGGGGGGGRR